MQESSKSIKVIQQKRRKKHPTITHHQTKTNQLSEVAAQQPTLGGGWTTPLNNMLVNLDHFPR